MKNRGSFKISFWIIKFQLILVRAKMKNSNTFPVFSQANNLNQYLKRCVYAK